MLYVGDVATANVAALERGGGGMYHVSTGIAVTVNDLFRKLAILTDYKAPPAHGPARKGDVYRIALDNSLAAAELGWRPQVSLEDGLGLTVDYFRARVPSPKA
jgi:UDP-glucose 4-epimerase